MPHVFPAWLAALALGQGVAPEPAHLENAVYRALQTDGLPIGGAAVRLPEPDLRDDQSADEQAAAILKVAGSKRRAEDLLRDSISAPFILKTPRKDADAATVLARGADLWFVIFEDLDRLDTSKLTVGDQKPVEAQNLRFETREVAADALKARGIEPLAEGPAMDRREWYIHATSRLLDRVHVEATNRVVLTRSKDSILIASRTDPRFRGAGQAPNRWWSIPRNGSHAAKGPAQDYEGGGGYIKISRLKSKPGALVVEAHFRYAEPRAWFSGGPILSSKFSLIAQDQIRRLRRDLAANRAEANQ